MRTGCGCRHRLSYARRAWKRTPNTHRDGVIEVHRRYRPGLRVLVVLIVAALFAWPAWKVVRRLLDYRSSYSGVVVEKGTEMDCTGGYFPTYLYIVIQNDAGKKSKKYTGLQGSRADRRLSDALDLGGYVVKDPGFGHCPREKRGPGGHGQNSNS